MHLSPGREQEGATPPPNLNFGVRRLPHHRRALYRAAPHHVTDTAGNGSAHCLPSPPPKQPDTSRQPHRPRPAGRPAPVERHCAANFSHGRHATSGMAAAAFRHVARYSEHTHRSTVCHGGRAATCRRAWRTAEQHAARATGDRLPCLLPMQATAGRTPALLALTPEQCPFWHLKQAPGSTTWGWTVFQLPSTHCAAEDPPIHIRWIEYTRLGLQGRERVSSPPLPHAPSLRPSYRGAAPRPRRTPASPQALLARVSRRSSFYRAVFG